MDNNNNQIRLNSGRFISRCFYEHKYASLMLLVYAVVSVFGDILKASDGDKDITVIFSIGAVIDILLVFFSVHAFFQGAKKRMTGFMEMPIMGFEAFCILYYLIFGYIRLSRIYSADGFFQGLLAWGYAVYIILTAISCVIVLSFLKSSVIVRQASSLIYFIVSLGIISSLLLSVSYFLCLIFVGYTNDSHIIFSFSDTLRLGIAPLLFTGYWAIFHGAATNIETIYGEYYEKLLSLTPLSEDDESLDEGEEYQSESALFEEEADEENFESQPIEKEPLDEPYHKENPDIVIYDESEISDWDDDEEEESFDRKDKFATRFHGTDDLTTEPTGAEKISVKPEETVSVKSAQEIEAEKKLKKENRAENRKKVLSIIASVLNVLVLGILLIIFFVINLIPGIIRGAIRLAAKAVKAFGWIRYKLIYSALLVSSDGKVPSKKLIALSNSKKKCYDLSNMLLNKSENVKLFRFKRREKKENNDTEV